MRVLPALLLTACAAQGAPVAAVCDAPGPARIQIDAALAEPVETLEDGSFEAGALEPVTTGATRQATAARTGAWGWQVPAGESFGARFAPERQEMGFSLWARSPSGTTRARLVVGGDSPRGRSPSRAGEWVSVGPEWTQVRTTQRFPHPVPSARVSIEAEGALQVDDLSITAPSWRFAEGPRTVGGIRVPAVPAAPFHFAALVHVEDEPALARGEVRWESNARVLEKLAELLHRHGGALTIQSELDWIAGAAAEAARSGKANRLARMAKSHGVQFSTHTHGPVCVDPAGIPQSAAACRANRDWSTAVGDAEVVAYVRARQEAVRAATGTLPTDHNGNFDMGSLVGLQAIGIRTLSAFKDKRDQEGLPALYTNPWRPATGAFTSHDPHGPLVYLPGAGVMLTRSPRRLHDSLARVLSQTLRHADADRVNTVYFVLAAGAFVPTSHDDRAAYLDGPEFARDLAGVEAALTTLVDPLVKEGYLRWSSLPAMGAAYEAWEKTCRGTPPPR